MLLDKTAFSGSEQLLLNALETQLQLDELDLKFSQLQRRKHVTNQIVSISNG